MILLSVITYAHIRSRGLIRPQNPEKNNLSKDGNRLYRL